RARVQVRRLVIRAAACRICGRTARLPAVSHRTYNVRAQFQCPTLCYGLRSEPLTVLVIGDPAATYLKPLSAMPEDVRIVVTRDRDRLRELAPEADVLFNAEFFDASFLH